MHHRSAPHHRPVPGLNRHIVIGCSLLLLGCLSGRCADRAFSAEPVAPAAAPNTLSGHELLRIGTIHDQQEHFPESLTYYNLALSKFREKKQPQGIATTLMKIARIDERQGHLRQAHTSLKEAVSLFAKASDRSAMPSRCSPSVVSRRSWGSPTNRTTPSPRPPPSSRA
jgi:hypothetical protein